MQMLKVKNSAVERQNNQIWSSEIIDDLMEEILKRLPFKKVFECMSISKHWRSTILSPAFTEIYRRQHPCYILINALDNCNRRRFYYSPLLHGGDKTPEPEPEEFVNSFTIVGDNLTKVTQPVEGFFCVHNFLEKHLWIYHVWRGEIMKLPYPLVRERTNPPDCFFFGFEPVNGVYKLLKITPLDKYLDAITRRHGISLDSTCFDCQILAMDSNNKSILSWRKLPPNILAPLFHPSDNVNILSILSSLRFSVDGFLFWRSPTRGLICFDLKEEKFFVIKPPPDLNQKDFFDSLTTQFRGQLALFVHNPDVDEKLILCTLTVQQHDDNQGYTYAWTKHFISLLSGLRDRYFPVGNLPTGEILLANLDTNDPFTIVYAYNHETHLFQRFVAGKLKKDFDRLKAQPKKLIYSVCCVQPSFSIPDAFGSCASFNSGSLGF